MPTGAAFTCPNGHSSDGPHWCDVCGLALAAPGSGPAGGGSDAAPGSSAVPPPVPRRCVVCDEELDGRFCEECGHDSEGPDDVAGAPGPTPTTPAWRAVVRPDRAWFDEVRRQQGRDAATLEFPRYAPEHRFVLAGAQVAIGRRSAERGTAPEIDLDGLDPGVSAAHAVLVARPDGGWELVDVGSRNGTTLAVEDGPIAPHRPVPLEDGAVVRIGAWTTITLTTGP